MLREGRFIIPTKDNNGRDTLPIVTKAISEAVARFGGATAYEIGGFWINPEGKLHRDPGMAVDVAYEPSAESDLAFTAIAVNAAREANQETVYIRLSSGEVSIPSVRPLMQAVA